jgi:hypothetical protein
VEPGREPVQLGDLALAARRALGVESAQRGFALAERVERLGCAAEPVQGLTHQQGGLRPLVWRQARHAQRSRRALQRRLFVIFSEGDARRQPIDLRPWIDEREQRRRRRRCGVPRALANRVKRQTVARRRESRIDRQRLLEHPTSFLDATDRLQGARPGAKQAGRCRQARKPRLTGLERRRRPPVDQQRARKRNPAVGVGGVERDQTLKRARRLGKPPRRLELSAGSAQGHRFGFTCRHLRFLASPSGGCSV